MQAETKLRAADMHYKVLIRCMERVQTAGTAAALVLFGNTERCATQYLPDSKGIALNCAALYAPGSSIT